jgi:hypothetical protein
LHVGNVAVRGVRKIRSGKLYHPSYCFTSKFLCYILLLLLLLLIIIIITTTTIADTFHP